MDETRENKKLRENVLKAIEADAADAGTTGVCTAWIVIAEFSGRTDEGEPLRTLYLDHAYFDGSQLVPWTLSGLLDSAYGALLGD